MTRALRITAVLAMLSATAFIGFASPAGAGGNGVTQIRGTAVPGLDCSDMMADYALRLPAGGQGGLEGCVYGVNDSGRFSPAGTASVRTTETFIGTFGGEAIEFVMDAHITFKESGLPGEPDYLPYFGRCQHKVVSDGVSGRINFKDIYEFDENGDYTGVVTFDYFGHLRVD